jgi:hypothetical protein
MARTAETSPIEVQHYLKGIEYPADHKALAETARRNGAPREVMELLEKLPGKKYDSPAEVMKAYGQEQ